MPWALQSATYTTAKPLNPLIRNASGDLEFTEDTEDGKLIATIQNCDSSQPENCTVTDGDLFGTGFILGHNYWYGIEVIDGAQNKDFAINFFEGQWSLLGGDVGDDVIANWGAVGATSATNWPGFRHSGGSWTDLDGNLWLFGGNGRGADNGWGYLNDLWRYNTTTKGMDVAARQR